MSWIGFPWLSWYSGNRQACVCAVNEALLIKKEQVHCFHNIKWSSLFLLQTWDWSSQLNRLERLLREIDQIVLNERKKGRWRQPREWHQATPGAQTGPPQQQLATVLTDHTLLSCDLMITAVIFWDHVPSSIISLLPVAHWYILVLWKFCNNFKSYFQWFWWRILWASNRLGGISQTSWWHPSPSISLAIKPTTRSGSQYSCRFLSLLLKWQTLIWKFSSADKHTKLLPQWQPLIKVKNGYAHPWCTAYMPNHAFWHDEKNKFWSRENNYFKKTTFLYWDHEKNVISRNNFCYFKKTTLLSRDYERNKFWYQDNGTDKHK